MKEIFQKIRDVRNDSRELQNLSASPETVKLIERFADAVLKLEDDLGEGWRIAEVWRNKYHLSSDKLAETFNETAQRVTSKLYDTTLVLGSGNQCALSESTDKDNQKFSLPVNPDPISHDPINLIIEENEKLKTKCKTLEADIRCAKDKAWRAEQDADDVRKNFFALLERIDKRTVREVIEDLIDTVSRRVFQ